MTAIKVVTIRALAALIFQLTFAPFSIAEADDEIIVVPSSAGRDGVSSTEVVKASKLLRQLAAARRIKVDKLDESIRVFEKNESALQVADRAPIEVDGVRRRVLERIADGKTQLAFDEVSNILEKVEAAPEELARGEAAAKSVLDICLFGVRAYIEINGFDPDSESPQSAISHATRCIAIVPDLAPSPMVHPPEVITAFEQAKRELMKRKRGTLFITSESSNCPAYLNGRRVGSTPQKMRALPAGLYRVQVDCPGLRHSKARVHPVMLGEDDSRVHVWRLLENAVETKHRILELVFSSAETENKHRLRAAKKIARATEKKELWLVSPVESGGYRVDRIQFSGKARVLSSVLFDLEGKSIRHDAGHELIESLMQKKSVDLREQQVAYIEPWQPGGDSSDVDYIDGESSGSIAGWIGFGVSAAAFATGWTLASMEPDIDQSLAQISVGIGAAGAAGMAIALPFVLPDSEATPWWAWLSGGVGVASIGAGVGLLLGVDGVCVREVAGRTPAEPAVCEERIHAAAQSYLLFATAVPLLTVPLYYLFGGATGEGSSEDEEAITALRLGITPGGLSLSGHF